MATCQRCEEPGTKLCSQCRGVRYCSQACQRADWPLHKGACKSLKIVQDFGLIDCGVATEKMTTALGAAGPAPEPPYVLLVENCGEAISARYVGGADAIVDLLVRVQAAEEMHGRVLSGGMHDRVKTDLYADGGPGHVTLVRLNDGEVQMGVSPSGEI